MNREEITPELWAEFKSARGEKRELMIHRHDCPVAWDFYEKHSGLQNKLSTSCFGCGSIGKVSIQHLELPDIYLCETCVSKIRGWHGNL